MSDRPTPETDAALYPMNQVDIVWPDFARKLERERDEARERERVAITSWDEERQRALREGERVLEAMTVANGLAIAARRCLGWHDHESGETVEKIANALQRWSELKEDAK